MDKLLVSLAPDVIIPRRIEQYRETFALYMCLVKKDSLLKYLIKNNIEAKVHYQFHLTNKKLQKI